MSMKGGVREAFAIILSKEVAVTHSNVVDLVAGATSVLPLPVFRGLLSFSAAIQGTQAKKLTCHEIKLVLKLGNSRKSENFQNTTLENTPSWLFENLYISSYLIHPQPQGPAEACVLSDELTA